MDHSRKKEIAKKVIDDTVRKVYNLDRDCEERIWLDMVAVALQKEDKDNQSLIAISLANLKTDIIELKMQVNNLAALFIEDK